MKDWVSTSFSVIAAFSVVLLKGTY